MSRRSVSLVAAAVLVGCGTSDPLAPVGGGALLGEDVFAITTTSLPNAQRLWPYQIGLEAAGVDVDWRLAGGVLPAGLSLHEATGLITGTPEEEGLFQILIEASQDDDVVSRQYELVVDPPPVGRFNYEVVASGEFTGWVKKYPDSPLSRVYIASATWSPPPELAGIVWDSIEDLQCGYRVHCEAVIVGETVQFDASVNLTFESGGPEFSATLLGHRMEEYGPDREPVQ